jgi:hypothetical protein
MSPGIPSGGCMGSSANADGTAPASIDIAINKVIIFFFNIFFLLELMA